MILGGAFVFLIGFLFLPDFYWTVPEDLQYIWYALGDAVQGIGGCFAIYTWGIWRAYRLLTMNEEYWRRKKKNDKKDIFINNIINSLSVDRLWEQNRKDVPYRNTK